MKLREPTALAALLIAACSGDGGGAGSFGTAGTAMTDSATVTGTASTTGTSATVGTASSASAGTTTTTSTGTASTTGPIFDVGGNDDPCKVQDDMDGVIPCRTEAPAGSFDPDIQWSWDAPVNTQVLSTPVVANLTDDDGDDDVDLCDVPDVVVVSADHVLHVLSGADGTLHWSSAIAIERQSTPAIGDIDGDGEPEIVALTTSGNLVAFEGDGTVAWMSAATHPLVGAATVTALALADIDVDGDVEIIGRNVVADHMGEPVWTGAVPAGSSDWSATVVADLDGDGPMEVIMGEIAWTSTGAVYYDNTDLSPASQGNYAQVANLDADPMPEILVVTQVGLAILEHDGTTKVSGLTPTGTAASQWNRPATVHDFDGDGDTEFASAEHDNFSVYEADATLVWSAAVADFSGKAGSTAFDFLGDATAEAMYADEQNLHVYDDLGGELVTTPRSSITQIEYPVVVDVDNDQSAEVLVVSNGGAQTAPSIQVVRDVMDRWIPARRIWNQHTYHVTNVREDGTIPQNEPRSWELLNTYRTQAQFESGGVCQPTPRG